MGQSGELGVPSELNDLEESGRSAGVAVGGHGVIVPGASVEGTSISDTPGLPGVVVFQSRARYGNLGVESLGGRSVEDEVCRPTARGNSASVDVEPSRAVLDHVLGDGAHEGLAGEDHDTHV